MKYSEPPQRPDAENSHPNRLLAANKEGMFNLDPAKLLVIGVVAVILLGPDRLPHVARQVGGFWRTFNDYRHRMESQVRDSMPDLPSSVEIARMTRSPSALLDHLSAMGTDSGKETAPLTPRAADGAPPVAEEHAVLHPAPRPTAVRPTSATREPVLPGDPGLN